MRDTLKRRGSHKHPVNRELYDNPSALDRRVDGFVRGFGSLKFIIWQTVAVGLWVALNTIFLTHHPFDPYPFILLNLMFSTQASYAAPLILMAGNRQEERDRLKAEHDYEVNELALKHIRESREENQQIIRLLKNSK